MILETTKAPTWSSPIPYARWKGFRSLHSGSAAFDSLEKFKIAQVDELLSSLEDHERSTLGRLLKRGQKIELEVFVRTHGPNPLFDPQVEMEIPVGVAKADVVNLADAATAESNEAILNGEVVHVLFQAGEASRFGQGPLYNLQLVTVSETHLDELGVSAHLARIAGLKKVIPPEVAKFLIEERLGPKQPVMIRAALRRIIDVEIQAGRLSLPEAFPRYEQALKNQKILFFVSQQHGVSHSHDEALRHEYAFYGFAPENLVTIEQELVPGIVVDEEGHVMLAPFEEGVDAAGHMYALMQAARRGDFTTYTESGRPIKPMELDALAYLGGKGGKYLNIIRINDMDRHTTEIVNSKAFSYAHKMFKSGYVNIIEGVANPEGQKGGTGTTFGDTHIHVLTETHENSFPALSRAFESAMREYLVKNSGRHPAYNAMRQWADLSATRQVLKEYGGRIVFVPRSKNVNGEPVWYLGVDMPMGDLSLLMSAYKSRMFQFADAAGKELLIHDMKKLDQLAIGLRSIERQLEDPHILAGAREIVLREKIPFSSQRFPALYGAPTPEFNS